MLTKIMTATLVGVEGQPVTVETDIHRGLPSFTVVGLADTTIKEACGRIKPAILNSGYRFPVDKVTVNLVPAGRPKEGSHFDLPIAVGIITLGWENVFMEDKAFLGEVSLDGSINPIKGALPLCMSLRKAGVKDIVLPFGNAQEASILEDMNILPATHIRQVIAHITGQQIIPIYNRKKISGRVGCADDFSQVIGQEMAKRAMLVGVAGNHGVLLMGGPGCGKTMMARRIPTIMPELTYEEKLEITGIYSVAGLLTEENPIVTTRPFRSPHHTISTAGLIGGGKRPRPGELSLAHRGVLFLDEFGEFESRAIDAMRQPVEEGCIRLTRNMEEVVFPSDVMVVLAANPCKCGYLWDERKMCTCTTKQIDAHRRKLTGPFSDRIDMHIKMAPVSGKDFADRGNRKNALSSADMRKQVEAARLVQRERYRGTPYKDNGGLDEEGVERFCRLDDPCRLLLASAYEKMGLTMRACSKLLKVARTVADIEGSMEITQQHLTEALAYRIVDWSNGAMPS